MKFTAWLDAAPGRSSALAKFMDRSLTAISLWRQRGVPVRLMKQVRDYTGGQVTLEEMVPETPDTPMPKRPGRRPRKGITSAAAITVAKPHKKQRPAASDTPDAQPDRREARQERRQCEGGMVAFVSGERRKDARRASEKARG